MPTKKKHPRVTKEVAETLDAVQLDRVDPVVLLLYQFGHGHNPDPDFAETRNIKISDLPKIKRDDPIGKLMAKSYQNFFHADIDEESWILHHRSAIADGDVGPATLEVMKYDRCGMPDYVMDEPLETRTLDPCKDKLQVSFSFSQINKQIARQAFLLSLQAWHEAIEMGFELLDEFRRGSHIWATDSALSGGILAWAMLGIRGCNAASEQRYNTRVNWAVDYLNRTMQHEDGHSFGLGHSNSTSAIMYPSIRNFSKPQPLDIQAMERLGWKKRTSPPPDPGPGPGPEPPVDGFSGLVTSQTGQKWMVVGVPQ